MVPDEFLPIFISALCALLTLVYFGAEFTINKLMVCAFLAMVFGYWLCLILILPAALNLLRLTWWITPRFKRIFKSKTG